MPMIDQAIISDIVSFISRWGGGYSDWYAGIASSPRERLFNDHNVNEQTEGWIYRDALNSNSARATEDHLVNTLGMDGNTGGGDNTTRFIYAYRKSAHTIE